MERKRNIIREEMSRRTKKARLDKPVDDEYSDQEISVHASYGEELDVPSPRNERGDTESPIQDVETISDSSESFQLTKAKSSETSKRKERHYRSNQMEQHHTYSERDYHRTSRREDESRKRERFSHSRSPVPPRRDHLFRGEGLKRESSSGRNSPMYADERSRDSLRDERLGREAEFDDSRYHERLSGSSRLLPLREESRHSERRGSREQKEMYERGGHREFRHGRGSGSRGGERGGAFSTLRVDRRGSLRTGRSPRRQHEHAERSRSSRPEISGHFSRDVEREHQRGRHHKVRGEGKEKPNRGHHRSRREEAMEEDRGHLLVSVVETINISSDSGDEVSAGRVSSKVEKIDELIRDLESGSSSGEVSEEDSDREEITSTKREEEEAGKESLSEKDRSSDGEVHSPSPKAKSESHVIKSRFDSDPESESESEEENQAKDVQLPSLAQRRGYSGYHDTVSSDEEHSEMSDTERPEEDRAGDKESDLSAQLSRELEEAERSATPEELPCYLPALMGCRNVEENYDYLNKIEEGTYGVVHRAKDKKSGKVFALKRLKLENEKEGFPITSLREIDMLLKAKHPNVVGVREIVLGKNMDRIYIVFEYVEHDLKELMETMKQPFLQGEVKTLMIQLLRAVHHLHDNWIIHRDLKASNLLVSHQAILKVADFGLAREYGSPLRKYTPIVVTLWYRAPELLLGAPEYSTPVDVWSVGCIFAEMMLQKPLFQGKGEIDQLNQIFKLLGTPNEQIWSGYNELPTVKKVSFTNQPYNHLRKKFPPSLLTQNGFDLLNRFLTYDPKKRITAKDALDHPYFKEPPMPIPPSMFNTWPAKSEMGHRKKAKSPTPPVGGAFQFAEDGPGFNLKF